MKNQTIQLLTFALLIAILVSCKSQQVTFTKVYEKDMPENASGLASFKGDGSYVIAFEEEPKGFGSAKGFVIDGPTGKTLWEKKKNDIAPGKGDYESSYWTWNNNVLLVFKGSNDLFSGGASSLSGIDIASGDVKFTLNAEDYGGDWEEKLFFLDSHNTFILSTDDGLQAFNIENGQQMWSRSDLKGNMWKSGGGTNLDFKYFDERNKMFVAHGDDLYSLDPSTGETIWKTSTEGIGSLHNADLFPNENLAIFYGSEDESLGKQIAESVIRSNELGNLAMNMSERGLIKEDAIFIDLESGQLMNKSKFYTNGGHYPIIHNDKLIMMGIVLNVYDKNTGQLIWQNIDPDRFSSDMAFKALSFLAGIDLTIGNRSKQKDLIFDNHIYAFYPEVLENAAKQEKISLRKYDLDTGEEIWKSETERVNVDHYFGAEGVLFIIGNTTGFISRPVLMAFDGANGEKLYELKLKSTRYAEVIPTNGRIYVRLHPWDLKAFEIRSGKEIPLNLPAKGPGDIRLYNDALMVAYGWPNTKKATLVAHNPKDFSVINQMELPGYFSNYDYRGNTFFIYDLESSEGTRGIIGVDLEKWALKGYILNSQSGSFTTTVGDKTKNEVFKDYHLFLSEDGKTILELEKDVVKKYAVD